MAHHQWLHGEPAPQVVSTSRIEMLAVLRCAASLADKEGMAGTAQRLRNDADRVEALLDVGPVTVLVS